ncbi:MAG: sigma-70 family RNA polymerase sigma factor [Planctomycetes bacterium]|nr:sigma-70 family RNA polymerase sigma factor [Planctomycetota bacterium]
MDSKQAHFLELLAPLKQPLSGYVKHLLWKRDDMEDALQNVLTEAYEKLAHFKEGTDFKSWIFQIATFTVFNMNRKYNKESNRMVKLDDETCLTAPQQTDNPDYLKLLEGSDRILEKISDEVKTSLSVLNDNERSVFLLRSLAGLDYAQIAQTLEIPIGSVMGNLARSRIKLRSKLLNYAKEQGVL